MRKIKRFVKKLAIPFIWIKNYFLCLKYPFLKSRNVWTDKFLGYGDTLYEWIPDGWRKAFGKQLIKDLRKALKQDGILKDFRFHQIKEKYGCYDEETEVLTKNGWKFFKDVTYNDEFFTVDQNNNIIYQKPSDIISYEYSGQMYYLNNRGINIKVTPNHNLYVAKGSYYNGSKSNLKKEYPFEFATPDIYFKKDKRFQKGGFIWTGNKPPEYIAIEGYEYDTKEEKSRHYSVPGVSFKSGPFIKFLGFYIAEGYTNEKKGEICIAYNEKDEEEYVKELLDSLNLNYSQGKNQKRIYNKSLAKWLIENCGHLAPNKKVPSFIKELDVASIKLFLDNLYYGDGYKAKTSYILTTTSKQLSDDVQHLILKVGNSFRCTSRDRSNRKAFSHFGDKEQIICPKHLIYEINWLKNNFVEVDNSKINNISSFQEKYIEYKGMVYCVTIPSHLLYVKRDGKGYLCGNSLRLYSNFVGPESKKVINKYERMSQDYCICCGKPAEYETRGWIEFLCKDCFELEVPKNISEEERKEYYDMCKIKEEEEE